MLHRSRRTELPELVRRVVDGRLSRRALLDMRTGGVGTSIFASTSRSMRPAGTSPSSRPNLLVAKLRRGSIANLFPAFRNRTEPSYRAAEPDWRANSRVERYLLV
jgi:hypothetical protein